MAGVMPADLHDEPGHGHPQGPPGAGPALSPPLHRRPLCPGRGAAAKAGAHIVDTAIGASVRWYGQGEVLSTAAYIEELGLKTNLNKDMIRTTGFVLKQIMPYYDRYTAPTSRASTTTSSSTACPAAQPPRPRKGP
jgi:hypothetical protein